MLVWRAAKFPAALVERQAQDAAKRAYRLYDLRAEMRKRVAAPRASALLPVLVDHLFQTPALTISTVMEVLGVTHRWASQTVDKLTDVGILREVPGPGRARLFIAPEVLRTIEGL